MSEVDQPIEAALSQSASVKDEARSLLEAQLRSSDPREYIEVTALQKMGRSIDGDPTHPWEQDIVSEGYFKDQGGSAVLLEVRDGQTFKLLLAQEKTNGEKTSAVLTGDEASIDLVRQGLRLTYYLPAEERHALVGGLIDQVDQLEGQSRDDLAEHIATAVLEKLPDVNTTATPLPRWPESGYGQPQPSESQVQQLERFLALAVRKLDRDKMAEMLADLVEEIPFTDGAYDKCYADLFLLGVTHGILERRLQDRTTEPDFPSTRLETKNFPVAKLVKNPVSSPEDLARKLSGLPVEEPPELIGQAKGDSRAEFVELTQVAGGPSMKDWTVSTSPGRGLENIYRLTQAFQKEGADINKVEPIQLFEFGGKYFVEIDGRHRVAALKALDVPFAPALVTHYKVV